MLVRYLMVDTISWAISFNDVISLKRGAIDIE